MIYWMKFLQTKFIKKLKKIKEIKILFQSIKEKTYLKKNNNF